MPLPLAIQNVTFAFSNAKLCSVVFLIITGIPIHRDSFPGKWFVAEWVDSKWFFCKAGLISLDIVYHGLWFLPLDRLSAASGECQTINRIKMWLRLTGLCGESCTPKFINSVFPEHSMQWLWNILILYLRVLADLDVFCNASFKNLISSGVQAAYLIFSRAVLILASCAVVSGVHIFSKYTTVVTWCQSAFPIAAFLTLDSHPWHQLCTHSTL